MSEKTLLFQIMYSKWRLQPVDHLQISIYELW